MIDLLRTRRSVRKFTEQAVEPELLELLKEAVRVRQVQRIRMPASLFSLMIMSLLKSSLIADLPEPQHLTLRHLLLSCYPMKARRVHGPRIAPSHPSCCNLPPTLLTLEVVGCKFVAVIIPKKKQAKLTYEKRLTFLNILEYLISSRSVILRESMKESISAI